MAAPTFTRANTGIGPTSAGVGQNSITPTYTAAAAGGYLVAVLLLTTSTNGVTIPTPPTNWIQQGSPIQLFNSNGSWLDYLDVYIFQNSAGDASTSAAFNFDNSGSPFGIVYEFNSTAGLDTGKIFTSSQTSSGASVSTGSGTADDTNDWQVIGGITNDSNFSTTAITGFTTDMGLADHGDGGSSFGGSAATFHKNAVNSSTTVAAQTITWAGSGNFALGFTLLMRPSASKVPYQPNYQRAPILAQ